MKIRCFLLLLLTGVLPVVGFTAETPRAKGFTVHLVPSRAVNIDDQFGGILPERPPQVPVTAKVVPDEPFRVNVLFVGAKVVNNSIALAGTLTMISPTGKKDEIPLNKEKLRLTKLSGDLNGVFPLPQELRVILEKSDPRGKYRFEVELEDLNGKSRATAAAEVELVDKIAPQADVSAFSQLEKYYQAPAPEYILPAFREFLSQLPKQKEREKQNFNPLPQLAFFYFLLKGNPQAVNPFAEMVKTLTGEEKFLGAIVLRFAAPDQPDLIDAKATQAVARQFPLDPFIITQAVLPWHLDVCWAEFMVYGTRAPVLKVVQSFSLVNDAITIDQFKKLAKPTDEDRRKLLNGLTVMAAQWSLKSLAEKHPLIRYYVEAALIRKEITEPAAVLMAAKAIGMKVNTTKK